MDPLQGLGWTAAQQIAVKMCIYMCMRKWTRGIGVTYMCNMTTDADADEDAVDYSACMAFSLAGPHHYVEFLLWGLV